MINMNGELCKSPLSVMRSAIDLFTNPKKNDEFIHMKLTFIFSTAIIKLPVWGSWSRMVAASTNGLNILCKLIAIPIVFTSLFISTIFICIFLR